MKLLVHLGLHKTGSTYLQEVLYKNRARLQEAGIHYVVDAPYSASHLTAWRALVGDMSGVARELQLAANSNSNSVVLSSEDFEGLIFRPEIARSLAETAQANGASELEWHVCLRDPGEYFASIHAEMGDHWFVDGLSMYQSAVDLGYYLLETGERRLDVPSYWWFCFDHVRYLERFTEALPGDLIIHDFNDSLPLPAYRLLSGLNVLDRVDLTVGDEYRNRRRPTDVVAAGYVTSALRLLGEFPHNEGARLTAAAWIADTSDLVQQMSSVVAKRFSQGSRELVAKRRISGQSLNLDLKSLPAGFNFNVYRRLNPDIGDADPEQHFLHHGRMEGRRYKY